MKQRQRGFIQQTRSHHDQPNSKSDPLLKTRQAQSGQSLIEYLILVALMAVSTIAVVRSLSYVVQTRFANTLYAIQGTHKTVRTETFDESSIKKHDLSDFMNGAAQ